jgi:diacylglycerol kinase family enzyme
MQTFLFVNPGSGKYAQRHVDGIVAWLTQSGLPPVLYSTRSVAEVLSCCSIINSSATRPLVVVAAGDGTFNAVINGLLPDSATVAILPLGTANVLAAELGIASLEQGLDRIAAGRTRQLTVGLLELESSCHRFVLMAGIGLDGAVVRAVRPGEKRLLKKGAFALSALRIVLAWDRETFQVVTPTGTIECHTAVVCNAARYGGSLLLAPGQDPCTTGFTLACMLSGHKRRYLRLAWDLARGGGGNGDLLRIPADSLEIRGKRPIQIDGDFIGYGPARLTSLPGFARIIV